MGIILGTRMTKDDKVVFEIEMDYEDSLKLRGHIKNIHVFSEDAADLRTNLAQRGTNDTTKYFLIPRELRDGLNFDKSVKCQKIETDSRKIFIFVMDNRGKKVKEILNGDDKELAYMEKKVKETEGEIARIRLEKEKKVRVNEMKAKLKMDNEELEELEKKEKEETEIIEDL